MRPGCSPQARVALLLVLLIAAATWGMPPPSRPPEGRVLDATTRNPLRGVRVVLLNEKGETVKESSTDSTGSYQLNVFLVSTGTVVYSSERYRMLRLAWPTDLEEQLECCCKLKDVYLKRQR